MSKKKSQLVVAMTGSIVALLILPMTATSFPGDATVLHRGATVDEYEAFSTHLTNKFHGKPSLADVKDLWVVWAKDNNIPESEQKEQQPEEVPYTGDILFIPEVDGQHGHIHSAIGITKTRKEALSAAVHAIGTHSTVSHMMSEASRSARSHAELIYLGFKIGVEVEKLHRKEEQGSDIGRAIARALANSITGSSRGRSPLRDIVERMDREG